MRKGLSRDDLFLVACLTVVVDSFATAVYGRVPLAPAIDLLLLLDLYLGIYVGAFALVWSRVARRSVPVVDILSA